jgi:hypothetical protein
MARSLRERDVIFQHARSNILHPPLGQEFVWFREIDRIAVRKVGRHADRHTGRDRPLPVLKRHFWRDTWSAVYGAVAESVAREN